MQKIQHEHCYLMTATAHLMQMTVVIRVCYLIKQTFCEAWQPFVSFDNVPKTIRQQMNK